MEKCPKTKADCNRIEYDPISDGEGVRKVAYIVCHKEGLCTAKPQWCGRFRTKKEKDDWLKSPESDSCPGCGKSTPTPKDSHYTVRQIT